MKEWQKRVVQEKEELNGRIERLEVFLDSDETHELVMEDVLLLKQQLVLMNQYKIVLNKRIARFA